MIVSCWTIIHHAVAPVRQVAIRAGHVARRIINPAGPHAAQTVHHIATGAGRTRTWVELVCKYIPAAVVGGGLVAIHPLNPARLPTPPEPIIQTAPPTTSGPLQPAAPVMPELFDPAPVPVEPTDERPATPPTFGAGPPGNAIPEPPSGGLLLGGIACLLLICSALRRTRPDASCSPGCGEPLPRQTHLIHPVLWPVAAVHQRPAKAANTSVCGSAKRFAAMRKAASVTRSGICGDSRQ